MVHDDQYAVVESAPELLTDNVWDHPTRKIRVCMESAPLSEIPGRAVSALRVDKPVEVHGILFGHAEAGEPMLVTIADVEFLTADVNAEALDKQIAVVLARRSGKDRERPLGYFRTQVGEGLSLTDQDRAVVGKYFRDPSSVILLVRPFEMGICMAGFFFWENGRLQGDYTDFEIPMFAPVHVETFSAPQVLVEPKPKEAPAVSMPLPPEPGSAATTSDTEQPAVDSEPAADARLKKAATKTPEATELRRVSEPEKVTQQPKPGRESEPAVGLAKASLKQPVVPAQTEKKDPPEISLVRRSPDAQTTPEVRLDKGRYQSIIRRTAWAFTILGLLAVIAYVGALRFHPGVEVLSSPAPNSRLGLQVARPAAGQLDVTWSRSLPPQATGGELTIADGALRRTLILNAAQLESGKLAYFPVGTDLSFQLKVFVQNAQPVTEFVQVLVPSDSGAQNGVFAGLTKALSGATTRAAALPVPRAKKAAGAGTAEQSLPTSLTNHTPGSAEQTISSNNSGHASPGIAPPTATGGGNATAVVPTAAKVDHQIKVDAPPAIAADVLPGQTSGDISKLNLDLPVPVNAPVSGPVSRETPQTPASGTQGTQPVKTQMAPIYVDPQPVRRVMPDLRTLLPGGVTTLTRVEVDVTIDNKGHVTGAEAINGNSLLARSALSAAKQWTFRPATLRGEPVASSHRVVFEFQPRR